MYPTLEDGEFMILNKLEYRFSSPQRGDIVVFRDPRVREAELTKRVVGLPGETVEIESGKVFVNAMLLEEPYITTPWNDTKPKILIPEGEYYVLGDNRDNSLDSRSSQVGLVPKDLIIGHHSFVYWPWAAADAGMVALWVSVLALPTVALMATAVVLLRRRRRSVWWSALIVGAGLGGVGLAVIYFWVKPRFAASDEAFRVGFSDT